MAKVLVLGGSGSVGATLIPLLVSVGHNVTVLNRGTRLMSGAGQIVADRNDAASLAPHAAAFDVVVDTSGYTGDQVEMAFAVFGGLTSKWIHLSSAAVYRETPDILPTEDTPTGGAQIWGDCGAAKSADLAEHYLGVAGMHNCRFFDAGSVIESSSVDGIHFDKNMHPKLGAAIAGILIDA